MDSIDQWKSFNMSPSDLQVDTLRVSAMPKSPMEETCIQWYQRS